MKLLSGICHGTLGLVLLLFVGCNPGGGGGYRELGQQDDVSNVDPHGHHHHDHGPHGGHIIELGHYHGEITMDQSRAITVYLLGDDAETAAPAANAVLVLLLKSGEEELEIPLTSSPLEGETDGASSRYVATGDLIPEGIDDLEKVEGSVRLTIGEETTTGKIEHDHDHHHH